MLWITGARGLLGTALMESAPSIGSGREVDIADAHAVRAFVKRNPGITQIINCAAYALVDQAETHREEAFRTNAIGPETLGHVAKEIGAHLIHISTDYVFSGELRRPLKESDTTAPCNHYGQTKLEGEQRLVRVNPDACILRVSWLFGRGGKNLVARLMKMLQEEEEILLNSEQLGRPTYVLDLVKVILQLRSKEGLYQFANRGEATKFSFGSAMREALEKRRKIRAKILPAPASAFPSPCKRPSYTVFDTTKIEEALNLSIRSWQEALYEFIDHL